jgi:two-component system, NtrC family, sensor kinase
MQGNPKTQRASDSAKAPKKQVKTLSPRYSKLRWNMILIMTLVTLVPLTLMVVANSIQYQSNLKIERINPMRTIVNKVTHSFELFLEERLSALHFIASAYSFEDLSDQAALNRIYRILREKFGGYVDLGLINAQGIQVSYAGPYSLLNRDYSEQQWFQEVRVRGIYISDVFMGYRGFPHIALAVEHLSPDGSSWVLRATMDTQKFGDLIAAIGLEQVSDTFVINQAGVLQTDSKNYGKALEKCALNIRSEGAGTYEAELIDPHGREVLTIVSNFIKYDFILVMVIPRAVVMRSWYSLNKALFSFYLISVIAILLVIFWVTSRLVRQIRDADERREAAFRNLEYTQKLSSIGRLAAGVAHEINNPLAIINEKAGLIQDLIARDQHHDPDKLLKQSASILQSVNRCRSITHRLLGFARRIGVQYEMLDVNEVLRETMGFLEKEALFRNLDLQCQLAEDLPKISSDRGQLQQVFLNILSNAFAAVDQGGQVVLRSWRENTDTLAVSIKDNGQGMSEETLNNIFEPFFTTKKEYGTGLGLSITYGIVKKLGGDIKVSSKLGEGSVFTLFLPQRQGD